MVKSIQISKWSLPRFPEQVVTNWCRQLEDSSGKSYLQKEIGSMANMENMKTGLFSEI